MEKALRDAISGSIYSGANETQRIRIVSMLGL
jgi:alkylation response protein AidB-like acyl-CoA dehydrogenase